MIARFAQSGQVGIAIILMMVVMSTVGFALATRASRDVQTSRQAQDAAQVFAAAEAIIESVLTQGETALELAPFDSNFTGIENIEGSYQVTVENEQTVPLQQGMIIEVPLSSPGQPSVNNAGNQIAIEWAESTDCVDNPASIIVTVINVSGPTPVGRSFASAGCDRGTDNIPVSPTAPTLLARRVLVTLVAGDVAVRITPLYNSTPVRITAAGSWTLPSQQYRIFSRAKNALGRETKAIEVERTRDFAPAILNYSLVSGNTITQ
jgi:type II secretory pathway pseudopilin PulG